MVVTIAVALLIHMHKRASAAAFSIFWMGITIAPMLNARWMAANVFTERYLYLPSVGFCWLVAWYGINLWDRRPGPARWPHRLMAVAAFAVALLAVSSTVLRNRVWRDDMTLYTRTLQTNPDAAVIRSNLGSLYFDAEQFDRALQEWQLALAQKPDNVVTMNALGILYTRVGRFADADAMFKQAMASKPLWGDSHFSHGLLLQKTGDLPGALSEFKTAVTLSPLSGPAHRWYGEALVKDGQFEEAILQLKEAVELEASLEAMHDLSEVYLLQGRNAEAEPLLRRMTSEFPYDSSAHLMLGKILEQAGKPEEARIEYKAGLANDPNNVEAKAALQRLTSK
jgi:tetratricopeptide (TPR) repeat protein